MKAFASNLSYESKMRQLNLRTVFETNYVRTIAFLFNIFTIKYDWYCVVGYTNDNTVHGDYVCGFLHESYV